MSKYENFNTLEDFQKYVDENKIESPKQFKIENQLLYQRLSKLRLCNAIHYKHRVNDFSSFNTLEVFQKYVDENKIESPKMFEKTNISLYTKAKRLKIAKKIRYEKRCYDWYNDFNTLEDFQKYVDENKIESPKQFKIENKSLYSKLIRLKYKIKYKNRVNDFSSFNTLEDFQRFVDENKIDSNHDFRIKYNTLYQKAGKLKIKNQIHFKNGHFWGKITNFNTLEDFQNFIDNNNILSPQDFKLFAPSIHKKACDLGFCKILKYQYRNFSKTEIDVLKKLEWYNIKYVIQESFEWLKNISGFNLKLDFYLPEYNIAIECQGKQHYTENKYFGGYERFKIDYEKDKLKYNLCLEHNIPILYYTNTLYENFKNVKFENYFAKVYLDINDLFSEILKLKKYDN